MSKRRERGVPDDRRTSPAAGIFTGLAGIGCAVIQTLVALLFAASLIGVGSFLIRAGGYQTAMGEESLSWPTVRGRITESRIETRRKPSSIRPRVRYEYEVEGRRYASTKIVAGDIGSGRDQAHRLHKLYSVGTEVDVFYKPDQPAIAVLQPGQNGSGGGLTGTGWVFLLGGLGILVWLCGALWTWARRFTGEDGPPADKSPGEDRQGAALAEDPDPHDQVRTDDEVEEARRRLGFS